MICNYCSALFDESRPHYCIAGRDFLMSEVDRLRADVARMTRNNTEPPEHIEKVVADYPVILERLIETGNRAEAAERELAALRAAVRWMFDQFGQLAMNHEDGNLVIKSECGIRWIVTDHAEALRRACE